MKISGSSSNPHTKYQEFELHTSSIIRNNDEESFIYFIYLLLDFIN